MSLFDTPEERRRKAHLWTRPVENKKVMDTMINRKREARCRAWGCLARKQEQNCRRCKSKITKGTVIQHHFLDDKGEDVHAHLY